MISRSRLLITVVALCHLLLATPIVTSQLLSKSSAEFPSVAGLDPPELALEQAEQTPAPPGSPLPSPLPDNQVLLRADEQEKEKNIFKAHGHVQVNYGKYVLRSDYATYDSNSGEITATGHVVFDGGPHDEHLEATHGTYNIRSESGRFYDVTGTSGVRFSGHRVILTSSDPFAFTGKIVDKVGEDHYVVHNGSVTSCKPPHPKWTFTAPRVTVELGGKAKIYNGFFRVRGIPLFYFPFADHPVQHLGRQSGFLVPSLGTSSVKGFLFGDAYYWAINRSMDATLGAEYYSNRGWAQHGEFRAKPSETSFLDFRYFGVTDQKGAKLGSQVVKEGGQDITLKGSGLFNRDTRGVVNLEYLSSFPFRLVFNQVFTNAVPSNIVNSAFVSRNVNGFSYNLDFERLQDFQGNPRPVRPLDYLSNVILHVPEVQVSSVDRQAGRTPLFWSVATTLDGVQRRGQDFSATPLVGRFDLQPDVTLPLQYRGWVFAPEFLLRDTAYTESANLAALPRGGTVNRRAAEAVVDLRSPSVQRIFKHPLFGHRFKHVIEPEATYRYVAGVDNFSRILRFDETDILTDTNQMEYGLTNRLYSKAVKCNPESESSGKPPDISSTAEAPTREGSFTARGGEAISSAATPCTASREIASWRVAQQYYFDPGFGGAVVPGIRNVFTSTVDFTPIAFLTGRRNFAPIISRLHLQPTSGTDLEWDVDYDTTNSRMSASTALINYRIGQFFIGGGHSLLKTPQQFVSNPCSSSVTGAITVCPFSQYRVLGGYGNLNRRGFNIAGAVGVDATLNFIQYSVFQTTYNWDCCGLTFEYRRFAIGPVQNDNQFRFAFSLSNVGTFGNLRRQERLF